MCVLLEVVDVLEVLPYATHFQTYVVLEVKHVVLEAYHTQRTFKICCVSSLSTIVMLVVHTYKGI